jgi:hypothetical protein
MSEFYLKNIINEGFSKAGNIIDWEFLTDDVKEGKWRLYYKLEECHSSCSLSCDKQHGFYFCSVVWAGSNCNDPTWCEETIVEILYRGCAYFDGLRHVYLGSEKTDNYGYVYYPSAKIHIEILQQLISLEEKYCRKD